MRSGLRGGEGRGEASASVTTPGGRLGAFNFGGFPYNSVPMNARDYALLELDRRTLPHWPAHQVRGGGRGAAAARPPEDARDYALAEQLVAGVIQNLLLLQH